MAPLPLLTRDDRTIESGGGCLESVDCNPRLAPFLVVFLDHAPPLPSRSIVRIDFRRLADRKHAFNGRVTWGHERAGNKEKKQREQTF